MCETQQGFASGCGNLRSLQISSSRVIFHRPFAPAKNKRLRVSDIPMPDGNAPDCTSAQSKTHSTEPRQIRYRWHPWFERIVWIYEELDKNGEGIRRCRSENNENARPLELPTWMFDETRCCCMRIQDAATVDCEALQRLKELLK